MRIILAIIAALVITSNAHAFPSFQEVRDSYKKSDAVLLDRHGKVIHELRVEPVGRRLEWTPVGNISPALIKSVVQSEDKRFFEHSGVDWLAVGSAVIKNIFTRQSRGSSTISMQLASMLDVSLKPKGKKRTIGQKLSQISAAKKLEQTWSKKEILEAYLNLVTFRGELQGISAASRGLFDKEPEGLDQMESAILASLIRAPNAQAEKVGKRACLLSETKKSTAACSDIKELADKTLKRKYIVRQKVALAPHVAHLLLSASYRESRHSDGKIAVNSTLDADLQLFVTDSLRHHLMSVRQQNVNDGAVLAVDNKTGEVLAYVGGIGESGAKYLDGVRAKRQAGSTLKPFLYAMAFDKRILTPGSILSDSPVEIQTDLGMYKPENYARDFKGMVSARNALASSLNIPAVRALSLVGVESLVRKLKLLGFDHLRSDDYYGYSLALGSVDISLWELVNAYRTLANRGVRGELYLSDEDERGGSVQTFSEGAAFIISDILSDREARSYTFSLENPLSTRYWAAVKTGTSKDMRDNWCVGYSDRFTVGVWVGNFSGAPMWNVSGVTGAAPVWLEIMNYLHRGNPSATPRQPDGVVARRISFEHGIEGARTEWFLENTEPAGRAQNEAVIAIDDTDRPARIVYPAQGTIVALDPDIPGDNQVIFFEAQVPSNAFQWVLNGRKIGEGPTVAWRPEQGKYAMSLLGAGNEVVDSVEFEVRGTGTPDPGY